ncbi:MAG TPA: K(+)-transporting ATPase subunit C [Verrucomicrobiae bacterium]|jgi:K+-transporting ATPase ATPase C chain|nr:K(+)-transporting ATPase subunit C [Verrucomicrobiae bacterium]
MKTITHDFFSSIMATLVLAVVCCGIYPLVVYGIAQAAFHDKANGSLIMDAGGTLRGSALLGQQFTGDKYFDSRPSAAGNGYDGLNSGGSNLGPTSQKLNDAIKDRIADYRKKNGLKDTDAVPADAVTASGSGLDPHISPANAALQSPRVAKVRGLSETKVLELVAKYTEGPDLGILGEPGVNVLKLNLALDQLSTAGKK